jgi:hypothetical protein
MTQHDPAEPIANVSTSLSTLANAKARVRIDKAERNADTVGFVLLAYRAQAGLTEQELADWLGISLPVLAALAEEIRPEQRLPMPGQQEMGLDQLAELYGADRDRLLEAYREGLAQ